MKKIFAESILGILAAFMLTACGTNHNLGEMSASNSKGEMSASNSKGEIAEGLQERGDIEIGTIAMAEVNVKGNSVENGVVQIDPDYMPNNVRWYEKPEGMSVDPEDGVVEICGYFYSVPAPFSEFEKNGWTISFVEKKKNLWESKTDEDKESAEIPKYLEPNDYIRVILKRNDLEFKALIRNLDRKPNYLKNCYVGDIEVDMPGVIRVSGGIGIGDNLKEVGENLEALGFKTDSYSLCSFSSDTSYGASYMLFFSKNKDIEKINVNRLSPRKYDYAYYSEKDEKPAKDDRIEKVDPNEVIDTDNKGPADEVDEGKDDSPLYEQWKETDEWLDEKMPEYEIDSQYADRIPEKGNSFAAIIEATPPLKGTKYNVYVKGIKRDDDISPIMKTGTATPNFGGVGAKIYDFDHDGEQELLYLYLVGRNIIGVMYEEKGDHVEAQAKVWMMSFEPTSDRYNNEFLMVESDMDGKTTYIINKNSVNLATIADFASEYLSVWNYRDGAFYSNIQSFTFGTGDVREDFVKAKLETGKHIPVEEEWLDGEGNVDFINPEKICSIETTENNISYDDVLKIVSGELDSAVAAVGKFK